MSYSLLDWSTIFIILHSNIYHFGMRFLAIQDKKIPQNRNFRKR